MAYCLCGSCDGLGQLCGLASFIPQPCSAAILKSVPGPVSPPTVIVRKAGSPFLVRRSFQLLNSIDQCLVRQQFRSGQYGTKCHGQGWVDYHDVQIKWNWVNQGQFPIKPDLPGRSPLKKMIYKPLAPFQPALAATLFILSKGRILGILQVIGGFNTESEGLVEALIQQGVVLLEHGHEVRTLCLGIPSTHTFAGSLF